MSEKYKGKVGLSVNNGSLRLRLPRAVFGGKQKYISLGLKNSSKNRRIAQAKAQIVELDILSGNFDQSLEKYLPRESIPQLTLSELYEQYIESKRDIVRPGTYKNDYRLTLSHLNKSPYRDVSPEAKNLSRDLPAWANSHLSSADVARRLLRQINASINWGIERNLVSLDRSPLENTFKKNHRKVANHREIDPFSIEQRDLIIEHFRNHSKNNISHYYLFVAFCFYTGCRTSEAIALERKNISADLQRITFSQAIVDGVGGRQRVSGLKTQDRRTVYSSPKVKSILEQALENSFSQIVFPGIRSELLGVKSFRKGWKLVLEELGIDYRKPYQTRHTFITLALEAGVSVKNIAKMVGNSPEIIYRHYAENVIRAELPDV